MPQAGSPQRVLITGCQGFTGRHLAARLQAEGHQVLGTCSRTEQCRQHPVIPPEQLFPLDLADPVQIQASVEQIQPDAVIHLAALAFVAHGTPDDFYRINLIGTRHLLTALAGLSQPPKKVILASSANIYGNSRGGQLDENTPAAPANDYAVSKLAMEHMARLWQDKLPITITRPFNYTGIGQNINFLIPKIVHHYKRRLPRISLGNLNIARDFSDVRYIAAAYANLLGKETSGQTINLCSGTSWRLNDILNICSEITAHRLEVYTDPSLMRANEVNDLCGDRSRLQHIYEEPIIPLEDTLQWMLTDKTDP